MELLKSTLFPELILISWLVPISEPISEPILEPISILESIPETDSILRLQNRFQKTSKLAAIDSDENFIFIIIISWASWRLLGH